MVTLTQSKKPFFWNFIKTWLLINFWFTRIQANKAAMKAMIVNKIGDFGLSLGIALIFFTFYSLDFATIFNLVPAFLNDNFIFFSYENIHYRHII